MSVVQKDNVTSQLNSILSKHLNLDDGAQPLVMDTTLEALGLDSMGAINLLLDLEDSFDIAFPSSLLTEETFRTPQSLAAAVRLLVETV